MRYLVDTALTAQVKRFALAELNADLVGVANIARFVPQLAHLPRYVAQGERGAGFAELARALLAAR